MEELWCNLVSNALLSDIRGLNERKLHYEDFLINSVA